MGACLDKPLRLQGVFKRLRCMCACCKGQVLVQNSEIDGPVPQECGRTTTGSVLQPEEIERVQRQAECLQNCEKDGAPPDEEVCR